MFGKNQTRWYIYTWVLFSTHVWILTHMYGKRHTCVKKATQLYVCKCLPFSTHVWEKPLTCLFPPELSVTNKLFVGPIGYRPTSCFFLLLLLLLLLLLQSLSSSSSFHHFYLHETSQPIHFLKAYDNSYSKTNREHKYKDKDECKDNDKDKDAERTPE